MAEYEKKVREVLRQNGFIFHHHIMKEAGIDYHF
jgi:hypothetical protein